MAAMILRIAAGNLLDTGAPNPVGMVEVWGAFKGKVAIRSDIIKLS